MSDSLAGVTFDLTVNGVRIGVVGASSVMDICADAAKGVVGHCVYAFPAYGVFVFAGPLVVGAKVVENQGLGHARLVRVVNDALHGLAAITVDDDLE
jgi:hypothetical protein